MRGMNEIQETGNPTQKKSETNSLDNGEAKVQKYECTSSMRATSPDKGKSEHSRRNFVRKMNLVKYSHV